jgi:hypothetical protein
LEKLFLKISWFECDDRCFQDEFDNENSLDQLRRQVAFQPRESKNTWTAANCFQTFRIWYEMYSLLMSFFF